MKNTIGAIILVLGVLTFLWLAATMPSGGEATFYIGYFLVPTILTGIGVAILAFPKKSEPSK